MNDLDRLLVLMHQVGYELSLSESAMLHHWGLHLVEDWRTLELIAEKLHESLRDREPARVDVIA